MYICILNYSCSSAVIFVYVIVLLVLRTIYVILSQTIFFIFHYVNFLKPFCSCSM